MEASGIKMKDFELRELQLAEYKMLKDVARLCDENGIAYFLDSGTLLGAVRHNGFIPWDDDIDICMDVANYRKFCRIMPKVLPDRYFLQNYKSDPKVSAKWSKVRINGTTSMDRSLSKWDIHFGVCMDVFVISGISKNWFRKRLQIYARVLQHQLINKYYWRVTNRKVSLKLERLYKYMPERIRIFLLGMLENLCVVDVKNCDYCYNTYYQSMEHIKIPSRYMNMKDRVQLQFEDDMFWVPKEYDGYLRLFYGDYWTLPSEEERGGHGDIVVDLEHDYKDYIRKEKTK